MYFTGGVLMNPIKGKSFLFYGLTLLITWLLWILAMVFAIKDNISIPYNEGFFSVVTKGFENSEAAILYVLFSAAVYGPLAGALITRLYYRKKASPDDFTVEKKAVKQRLPGKWIVIIICYPIVLFFLGSLISCMTTGFSQGLVLPSLPLWFLPILFAYQVVTSGTEEFGWRGFLQPLLQKKYSAEKACYIVGLLWSIWHIPFIIFTNYQYGLLMTALAVGGFILLTVPQAFVMGWLYNSTKSAAVCMLFHAWSNTVSFYILAMAPNASFATIFIAVMTWLAANYLIKKFGKEKLELA